MEKASSGTEERKRYAVQSNATPRPTDMDLIEDSYRTALDTIFCGILIFDPTGALIHYNRAAGTIFADLGLPLDQALHTTFSPFTRLLGEKVDLIRGTGRYQVELEGHRIVCNVHAWMVGGVRQGTILIFHESMHANCIVQEMDVTNSLLQEINIFVESSHDGILVTDNTGAVIRVNAAFERAFSVLRRDVLGRNVRDLIADGLYSESAALKVMETRKTATVCMEVASKTLIATGTPVFDPCGSFTSVVVNIRDMTELNELKNDLQRQQMMAEAYSRALLRQQAGGSRDFVVCSREMQQISETIQAISQVDSTVLITGESGTGKEMVVNQICRSGPRSHKPLIKINCCAIPAQLFESEMFGYEDGAFTGARRKGKAGFFELAHEGTLFLDEIGELDPELQVKLLRVIQEGEITRIGGTHTIHVDVRLIAATNRDLWQMTREGTFRQDLYYRLNVINIEIPPLRRRRDDIIPLARHFLEKYNKKYHKRKALSMELGKILRGLPWVGNIRELENLIENMVVLVREDVLLPKDLPDRFRQTESDEEAQVRVHGVLPLKDAVRETERQLLRNAQAQCASTREMAKLLEVDQSTVSRKMQQLLHQ